MTGMARITTFLLAVLVLKTSWAQQGLPHVRVIDGRTDAPVERVHVRFVASGVLAYTDAAGRVDLPAGFPQKLRFSHIAYEDLELTVFAADLDTSGALRVRMQPRVVELAPVEVRRQLPELVYQRQDLHVGDYHVNRDGLWVLVYERPQLWHRQEHAGQQVLRGARLHLLDSLFQERSAHSLPTRVRGLHRDHMHRVIVEGEGKAWVAEARGDAIALAELDGETLHRAVLPWRDTIPGLMLGNNLQETYPAFEHLAYEPVSGSIRTICHVEDVQLLQLFRSQYKYMSGRDKVVAMDLEKELGVDREVIAGYMTGFHKDIYYRVPYAPLFVVNDTLCVFDHYRERLRYFTQDLEPAGEVPIVHQRDRSWRNKLLQDPVTGRIYSVHGRQTRTTLREIDPRSGLPLASFTLLHPFPEEVKVFDGHAWYIHRPYGSTQHRTLYREALR
jgi:hypothetical protein